MALICWLQEQSLSTKPTLPIDPPMHTIITESAFIRRPFSIPNFDNPSFEYVMASVEISAGFTNG